MIGLFIVLAFTGCASSQDPADAGKPGDGSADLSQVHEPQGLEAAPHDEVMLYAGPEISAPPVEPCPYIEEVNAVEFDQQFQRALELGCEHDIHGDITFTEPIQGRDGPMLGLLSPAHAMTIQEMHEAGYISDADFAEYLHHAQQQPGH